jgi:hypothetical protein
VREQGLRAARGATDFGEYFTYFSFFLVASALLLAALFFRLTVEQRARETGLLRAVGFGPARVRQLFLAEGFILACAGAVVGVAGAIGYGALMMAGLRTWWSGARRTTSLTLHVTAASLAAGAAGAVIAAMACIWWTLRKLSRISERSLLVGNASQAFRPAIAGRSPRAKSYPVVAAFACAAAALALVVAGVANTLDRTAAFFGSGDAAPRRWLVRRRGDSPPPAPHRAWRHRLARGGAHRSAQRRRSARPQHPGDRRDCVRHVPARRRRRLPARGANCGRSALGHPAAISCSPICCCPWSTIPTVATATKRSGSPSATRFASIRFACCRETMRAV